MEKTTYKVVAQVETVAVLPRTLEIVPEQMKLPGADATMFVVYGKDPADRKVWCATFIDDEEAQAWVHGSKTFGRPVRGAVMAGQEVKSEKGAEMSDDATAVAVGNDDSGSAGKPN
jgi:hypothetical protein